MIVVHFINNDGGVGSVVANLSNELIKNGHHVIVCTSNTKFSFLEKINNNIEIIRCKKSKVPPMLYGNHIRNIYFSLKNKYPNEKIVLHAHNFMTIGVLENIKDLPLLCTIHGLSTFPSNKKTLRSMFQERAICKIIKKMNKNGQSIVGVSEDTSNYYSELSGKNISTIYNGCPTEKINKSKSELFTIAHIGDISESKGWNIEFKAFSDIIKRCDSPKVQFVFAGRTNGISENEIKQKIDSCRSNNGCVKYLGFISDVKNDILKYTDILLLMSKSEGLPMAIVEAQQMGIPVIATNVGGIPEIIENKRNGYLIERDAEVLQSKIEYLMDNSEILEKMSKESINMFLNKFTLERMYNQYFEIYKELMRKM